MSDFPTTVSNVMVPKLTVTIEAGDKLALEAHCISLGYIRGGRPNISELVRSIASGRLILTVNPNYKELPTPEDLDAEF